MNRPATLQQFFRALCVLLFFAAASIPAAHAQTALYGQFDATKVNLPSSAWGYGGGIGLYSDFQKVPFGKVGGDIRVQFTRLPASTTLTDFLVGPRFAMHLPAAPVTPYVEALIGGAYFSYGNNAPTTTQFDWRVLGGLDKTVLPHLDWRVVEVSYGEINTYSGHLQPITFSTGIVLRLH